MLRIVRSNRSTINSNSEFSKKSIVYVQKVAKTTKGSKAISFVVIIVIGNEKDLVGVGRGKSRSVSEAIDKASSNAIKNVIMVPNIRDINYSYCASKVLIRRKINTVPRTASYLTEIFEAFNKCNVSCKIIGSKNVINNIFCVFNALKTSVKISNMLNLRKQYLASKYEI